MNSHYCTIVIPPLPLGYIVLGRLFKFAIGLQLLLHGFLHADGVHHQFKMLEDSGLVSGDVAFDGIVAEEFAQVAFDHDQVQQV